MGLKVADFFCGAGGFSEGFRQMGFKIIYATDIWPHAVGTFRKNFPEAEVPDPIDILDIETKDLPDVDVIIGGPPCTFFSSSNSGGNGNVRKGMELVRGFLRIVDEMKPRWWIMENVPRLSMTLPEMVSLQKGIRGIGKFIEIPTRKTLNAADYGVPQGRKRLFSGNYPSPPPSHSEEGGEGMERWRCMREIIECMPYPLKDGSMDGVNDPLYPLITLDSNEFTEHRYDTFLTETEVEEVQRLKTRHRYYGKMSFPDDLDRLARTVVASMNRTSREAIVIEENRGKTRGYRIPTLRECASLQSFPITFQFWAPYVRQRYELVGNAVPPILSRAIAKSILVAEGLTPPDEPILRKKITGVPDALPPNSTSKSGSKRKYPLHKYYCDFIDYRTNHSSTGCRIDIDNKGNRPKEHPVYGKGKKKIRHIVEWRCVLYTGYAKNVQNKKISLDDALSLLNKNNPPEFNKKMVRIIDDMLTNRIYEIPDATTCQGILSRRILGIKESPFWIREMLVNIIEDAFPEKDDSTSKIKDSGNIFIRPEIKVTQRNAAQLIVAALACAIMNESDLWLSKKWDKHFRLEDWPEITEPPISKKSKWVERVKDKVIVCTGLGGVD